MPNDPAEQRCRDVLVALRRIIRAIDLHSGYLAQRYQLTGPQLYVLQALSGGAELTAGALAKACSMSQATMTGILQRLEKRELVQRRRSERDKRSVLLCLTPAGRDLLAQGPPGLQESFVATFLTLQDWEQSLIVSSLQRVVTMMEAGDIEATPILTTETLEAREAPADGQG